MVVSVRRDGTIRFNPTVAPVGEPDQWSDDEFIRALESLPSTCALDVAEDHPDGATPEQMASLLGVPSERVRHIEARAVRKLSAAWGTFDPPEPREPESAEPDPWNLTSIEADHGRSHE